MIERINRQPSALPTSFPLGSVYVLEGTGGQYGHLRVSSRYVVLPGGQRIDVPAAPGRSEPHTGSRTRLSCAPKVGRMPHGRRRSGAKRFLPATKKFAAAAGTKCRAAR